MKKYSVLIILTILILLGGGVYFLNSNNRSTTEPVSNKTQDTKTSNVTGRKSLKEMLSLGTSQKCTFKDDSGSSNVEGTSYISGGKVRSDYTTTVNDKNTTGHMIFDGKNSFIWMEGEKTGMTMEVDLNKSENTSTENSSGESVDMNKTFDYQCNIWIPEASLFTPPNDVKFQSFVIPTMTQGDSATGSKNLCDTCNSLTGDQKTQCLKAFSCN